MSDACPFRTPKRPCGNCPWVTDTPPGEFPAERYEALRSTTGGAGREAQIGDPMFACHHSAEGDEYPCAGWLAAVGYFHLGVRFAVIRGAIPSEALRPGEDWPELFESYDDMAEVQAG
mgnify:CR=1 FL=1